MKDRAQEKPPAKTLLACSLGFILAVISRWPAAAGGALPDSGQVSRVADGDTVSVRFADGAERRVRLIGVDAPEIGDKREAVALRAFLSQRFAVHHLSRRKVRLTTDYPEVDEHGRVLAYVWTEDGTLFNDFIIRQGFASAFLKYPFRKDYQERLRSAEAEARAKGRGFWRPEGAAVISASKARDWIGEIVSVRFRCAEISKKSLYLHLRPADGAVEAIIPRSRLGAFSVINGCLGKEVIVSGFLEVYRGRPQLIVFFPRQLRLT